jgi:SAM-dependent methyltransferase
LIILPPRKNVDAGFAELQAAENALVPQVLSEAGVDWVLECAPAAGVSPLIRVPRHRILRSGSEWVWPCRVPADRLPFADESLPALLIRHLFWLDEGESLLIDALRCLQPGGLLVSVSANPWHRASWRELGRDALRLPAWPRFLMQHARQPLQLAVPGSGWLRAIEPLAASVTRLRFENRSRLVPSALTTSCRAA